MTSPTPVPSRLPCFQKNDILRECAHPRQWYLLTEVFGEDGWLECIKRDGRRGRGGYRAFLDPKRYERVPDADLFVQSRGLLHQTLCSKRSDKRMTTTHKTPDTARAARRSVKEAAILPSLDLLLQDIEALPGQLRFGRRNNCKYCPLAKILRMCYGGIWLVEEECILHMILSKRDDEDDQVWCYLTPGDYADVLQRIDDPSWQPGQPQRMIKASEVAAILRAVLESPKPQRQQDQAV